MGLLGLDQVDDTDGDEEEDERDADSSQSLPASQGETEDDEREAEEHDKEVEASEPAVTDGGLAEELSDGDGDAAHEGEREPDDDPGEIEEEMTKGDLEGCLDLVSWCCERG